MIGIMNKYVRIFMVKKNRILKVEIILGFHYLIIMYLNFILGFHNRFRICFVILNIL